MKGALFGIGILLFTCISMIVFALFYECEHTLKDVFLFLKDNFLLILAFATILAGITALFVLLKITGKLL